MLTQASTTRSTDLTSVIAVLPRHILVVEDDTAIRDLVVEILEVEGYVVIASGTPVAATRLLDQLSFDLVITDGFSTLPGAAFSTTADLVQSPGSTPVILFSAHTHDLGIAKAAGFSDLINKPFDLATLVHQIKVMLAGEHIAVEVLG